MNKITVRVWFTPNKSLKVTEYKSLSDYRAHQKTKQNPPIEIVNEIE